MENLEFFLDESTGEFVTAPVGGTETTVTTTNEQVTTSIENVEETHEEVETNDDNFEITPEIYEANYGFLKDAGYLILPDDFKFEPTEDGWQKALEENNKNLQEVIIEDMFGRVPDEGRLLLNYFLSGGTDIEKYQDTVKFNDYKALDPANEDHQKSLVEKFLRETTQFSKDEISDYIEDLEINNKLSVKAKEAFDKLDNISDQRHKALLAEGEKQKQEEVARVQKSISELSDTIKANKNIFGIPFSDSDAKLVVDSFFKPIKMQDGSIATSYEMKYFKAMQDPKKAAILAKIIENDFDFSFIGRKQTTDATKNFKKQLSDAFKVNRGNVSTGNNTGDFNWDSVDLIKK